MSESEYLELTMRQLKLRSGVALQTRPDLPDAPKEEAHFLAAIDGKGVMVSHEGRTRLQVGSDYWVSGFTGMYDFHFSAPVIQTFDAPFAYSLLACPSAIKARLVRRAARMKVSLPGVVRVAGRRSSTAMTILDLSVCGAMFNTPDAVGGAGDPIEVEVAFLFESVPAQLFLASTIRHSYRADTEGYHVGVSFRDLTAEKKLLLHYLAYSATE